MAGCEAALVQQQGLSCAEDAEAGTSLNCKSSSIYCISQVSFDVKNSVLL